MIELLSTQLIAESLPISSSGHCALIQCLYKRFAGTEICLPQPVEWASHLITVCIMALVFAPRWLLFIRHPLRTRRALVRLIAYGVLAEICTASVYSLLSWIDLSAFPLWIGFSGTAICLYSDKLVPRSDYQAMRCSRAALLGVAQGCALIPGLSRMGVTYAVGRLLGCSPRHAFSWSCTLAVPPFIVAGLYGVWSDPRAIYQAFSGIQTQGIVVLVTFLSLLALLLVQRAVERAQLWKLSWYMIIPILLSFFMF